MSKTDPSPQPTYPFAPGVIDGPQRQPLSLQGVVLACLKLAVVAGALGMLAGYLIERFA
ncbi:hypothetical protein [Rhodoferax sp.]|uniref:hypothetical protein n=1 Tax=Rhodoferax sp. TaxID=50421 RepID=UPI002607F7F4|nr:hypothetical protein [Rhodoferax sp.]MDD5479663.1 hypothetical protein [Rhodoferax sp.]